MKEEDSTKKCIFMDLQVHGTNLLRYPGHLLEMPNKDKWEHLIKKQ